MRLAPFVAAWLLLAACAAPPPALPDPLSPEERAILSEVNRHRARRALPPLAHCDALAAAARAHSEAMAAGHAPLGHRGFRQRAMRVARTVSAESVAENVGRFAPSDAPRGQHAVRRWLASPPHRRALEGPFDVTGVGAAHGPDGSLYITQLFARRGGAPPAGAAR